MTDIEIHTLEADDVEIYSEVSAPTLSVAANYAEDWYADALAEVNDSENKKNKRREIVFAVCFLESYIYEWVRNYGTNYLAKYFTDTAKNFDGEFYTNGLKNKWKYIPPEIANELGEAKDIKLDLSGLGRLIKLRNGFIHAKASKLYNSSTKKKDQPVPTQEELDNNINSGWAVSVAENLVISLHEKMNSDAPIYLKGRP